MTAMSSAGLIVRAAAASLLAASLGLAADRQVAHRVWLLAGVPDAGVVSMLRGANVRGFCLPTGKVTLGDGVSHFEADVPSDLGVLSGSTIHAVVWVEGELRRSGDSARFAVQLAAIEGKVGTGGSLILVSRRWGEGLVSFASELAGKLRRPVELALPLGELLAHVPKGGWEGVRPVAFCFGNPEAFALPSSTTKDDLDGLDALDARNVSYRAAIVVLPRVTPPPGPAGASLGMLTRAGVSTFQPGANGDIFVLQRSIDWGGSLVSPGGRVEVDAFDTARYHRDLGYVLRPARAGLEGWDTVGLPGAEPTVGLSREALIDYLRGGGPAPAPRLETSWAGNRLDVELANPTPHTSAVSSTGNWFELQVVPGQVADVQMGDFNGLEFGRLEGGALRSTVLREASVLRFYLTYVTPQARVGGASVTFVARPTQPKARWGVRLGDGRDLVGEAAVELKPL